MMPLVCAVWFQPTRLFQALARPAMDELFNQTRGIFVNDSVQPEQFTKQIAFNAIPHIDVFLDDGFTKEEWKMSAETKELEPSIELVAHCVRIPVYRS